eukprot:CAMPEP_0171460136 /NCGR_PEP_ID=MMETSP0945-20130129/5127_1 /TAXON_ID=109269 /ORGANISM="Vaucheria litorea, Strain CCMP2940" /LENGTH=117 /DNA_ID=CAMNT_0011986267 /DNA_START=305 /DNA_END=656 /DNA_ORIENTATION=+
MRFVLSIREKGEDELKKMDSSDNNGEPYLIKHGNGKQIQGLEIGLHGMKVGGKEGYMETGLGPIPANSFRRNRLSKMLQNMKKDGELVFDVELLEIFDDEADVGYYTDETFSKEEID